MIPIIVMIIGIIVNVAFSAGVHADANALIFQKRHVSFVAPLIWTGATLIGGVPVVLMYWVIHHSTLRRDSTS